MRPTNLARACTRSSPEVRSGDGPSMESLPVPPAGVVHGHSPFAPGRLGGGGRAGPCAYCSAARAGRGAAHPGRCPGSPGWCRSVSAAAFVLSVSDPAGRSWSPVPHRAGPYQVTLSSSRPCAKPGGRHRYRRRQVCDNGKCTQHVVGRTVGVSLPNDRRQYRTVRSLSRGNPPLPPQRRRHLRFDRHAASAARTSISLRPDGVT
ncbi:hypothetical protein HBB16_17080 [Pseudonocardia sp. MCCB 268]|nr:hypothetical protein [Pseudonocardia cytotoxica]